MLNVLVTLLIFACTMLPEKKQAATQEHEECWYLNNVWHTFGQIVYCLEKLAGRTVI